MTTTNVPSDKFEDLKRDVEDATRYSNSTAPYTNRVGQQIRPIPLQAQDIADNIAASEQALANSGFIPKGDFTTGGTAEAKNEVFSDGTDYWRYDGALPFTVTAGSSPTPTGVGAWINVTDGTLRSQLAASESTVLISGVEAVKLTNREVNVKDLGAKGDDSNDDTAAFTTNPEISKYVSDGTYLLSGASVTLDPVKLRGSGILKTNDVGEKVLSIGGGDRLSGAVVDGLIFQQPNDPSMSGGVANNHFALKLFAVDDSRLSNLSFEGVDLCLGFEYGAIALGDRSCFRNVVNNVVGYDIRGMGVQIFGSKQGVFTGLTFEGINLAGDAGSKALFHGLRLNALSTSVNRGNYIQLISKNFANGVSLQENSYFNTVTIHAENCVNGVFTHGKNEGVSSGVSTDNTFNISADGCEYAVYEGGSNNTYNIKASGCTVGGLFSDSGGGDPLLGVNNTYTGSIKDTVGRLADIRSTDSTINLNLRGVGAASTFGLILQGNGCSGHADVRSCNVGVSITGDDNLMSLSIRDSVGDDLQISGSNNVVTVNCEGNVTITGNNNVVLGRIGGTVTDSGTGNVTP